MSKRAPYGMLDTSVVLELEITSEAQLPEELAISTFTMAELTAGPHATNDLSERALRQERLQLTESLFDPLPFDVFAARAYGSVYAAVLSVGRKPRGPRVIDLLIASIAISKKIPLYTRNPKNFHGLKDLCEIMTVT